MSFPMDASLGAEALLGSSAEDSLETLSAATDVLDLLRRADAITPPEIDLWAALVVGEAPELFVHGPRPPSPTMLLALAESMGAEARPQGQAPPEVTAAAGQARLSCACLHDEVLTGLSDVHRDHLTRRGQTVAAVSRAGATSTKGLTLNRWRQAEEALEITAWVLGTLADPDPGQVGLIDPITGVYSRAFFGETLSNELARQMRAAAELAVIVLQLRRSKPALADIQPSPSLLAFVAETIRQALRRCDLVARTNSRQFALMMPNTSPRAGLMAATRVGKTLRELGELDGWSIDIGVSGLGVELSGADELLEQAETAMRAAERGRTEHPFVYV